MVNNSISRMESAFVDALNNANERMFPHTIQALFNDATDAFSGSLDAPHLIPTGGCVSSKTEFCATGAIPHVYHTPRQGLHFRDEM